MIVSNLCVCLFSGRVLGILFDERRGLLFFLKDAVDQIEPNKDLGTTIIEAFELLNFLILEFTDVYEPYIEATLVLTDYDEINVTH